MLRIAPLGYLGVNSTRVSKHGLQVPCPIPPSLRPPQAKVVFELAFHEPSTRPSSLWLYGRLFLGDLLFGALFLRDFLFRDLLLGDGLLRRRLLRRRLLAGRLGLGL